MTDKYKNFAELSKGERAGVDFRICICCRRSKVMIIAPHGGRIEPGTSKIAAAIAADVYSLYCFEGLKRRKNRDLHMTSTCFDEPKCLALVSAHDYVVAVHGCNCSKSIVFLGGQDDDLRNAIRDRLQTVGFATEFHSNPALQGLDPHNICNRGRQGHGVQLEISRKLRDELTADRDLLNKFAGGARSAISASAGYAL